MKSRFSAQKLKTHLHLPKTGNPNPVSQIHRINTNQKRTGANIIQIQQQTREKQASLNYTSPTFNGCPISPSIFFPLSCSFLLGFIRWPLPVLVSCFQITLLPKGWALLYHPLCLSSTLVCFLPSWGPKSLSFYLRLPSSPLFFLFLPNPLKNCKILGVDVQRDVEH